MSNFYTDVIRKDSRFNSINICKDINLLEPRTRKAVQYLLELARKNNIDMRVAETFRSQQRQSYLFEQGYTELKKVGCHNYGLACDFSIFDENGHYVSDGQKYEILTKLCRMENVFLISGCDWGMPKQNHPFKDFDHVQRCTIHRQAELFRGTWYPTEDYNPYKDGAE
jgi:D-alanyl-D-alanine carboxypeptidase